EDLRLNKRTIKATSTWNHKFNARHNLQAGVGYTQHYFDFYYKVFDEGEKKFITEQNHEGDAGHYHGFISWKYRQFQTLTFVSGDNAHGTTLNRNLSVEPRASVSWQFLPHQALSAGYSLHGKMQSLPDYYSLIPTENGSPTMPNKAMGFSKAHHYVLGYEN